MPVSLIMLFRRDHEDTGNLSAKILLFCKIGKSLVLAQRFARSWFGSPMMQLLGANWANRQKPIIIKKLLPVWAPDFMQIISTEGSKKSASIWRAHGYLEKETRPGILGETSDPTRIFSSIHSEGLKS